MDVVFPAFSSTPTPVARFLRFYARYAVIMKINYFLVRFLHPHLAAALKVHATCQKFCLCRWKSRQIYENLQQTDQASLVNIIYQERMSSRRNLKGNRCKTWRNISRYATLTGSQLTCKDKSQVYYCPSKTKSCISSF